MPRIRSIKPEFWQDELVAGWPPYSRLAYIALWNEADDEGRLRASPTYLHSRVFPYEPTLNMTEILAPIIRDGRLQVWAEDGQTYGFLPRFRRHQAIDRPGRSKLPGPPLVESSTSPRRVLDEHSAEEQGSGNREQGTGNRESDDDGQALEAIRQHWNGCASLPTWRAWTDGRRRALRARLKEHTPEEIKRVITHLAAQDWATGRTERRWRADPEYLLRPGTIVKQLEKTQAPKLAAVNDGYRKV